MSRSKGWITSSGAGMRVAGKDGEPGLTYVVAHTINGKPYNQRVTFTVYVNSNKGVGRDGTPGRSDRFQLVAYGALADAICRCLSNGMAIDAIMKPHSYQGRSFLNGVMRLEADGSPVMVEKVGFQIVESPTFGEESRKTIDREKAEGRRPANWDVENHPDAATWAQMLRDRANAQYVPGSLVFGYAKVIIPQGPGIAIATQAPTGPAARAAREAARAGGNANTQQNAQNVQQNAQQNTPPDQTTAVNPTQLAALVAQVIAAQAQQGQAGASQAGVDSKTGFTTGTAANTAPDDDIPF